MVYIIQGQNTKEIKIGCTNNLNVRLKANAYEKGEPITVLAILGGSFQLENRLRNQFRHIRIVKKRDWYYPYPDIMQHIQQVKTCHPLVGKEFLRIDDEIERTMNDLKTLFARTQNTQTKKILAYFIREDLTAISQ